MDNFILKSQSGVQFKVSLVNGKYKIHLYTIPDAKGNPVEVYGKCIKKYARLVHCNEWYDAFEAMNETDQELYIARFLKGKGKQVLKPKSSGDYVLKRVVTIQLFIRRGEAGWRKFDTYSNPAQLKRAISRFRRNGYQTMTEEGVARTAKILKSQVNEASKYLIISEVQESYGQMKVRNNVKHSDASKLVRGTRFWSER